MDESRETEMRGARFSFKFVRSHIGRLLRNKHDNHRQFHGFDPKCYFRNRNSKTDRNVIFLT
jgi:hypothetical protein